VVEAKLAPDGGVSHRRIPRQQRRELPDERNDGSYQTSSAYDYNNNIGTHDDKKNNYNNQIYNNNFEDNYNYKENIYRTMYYIFSST
jgi:hypothetical protein